MSPDFALGSDEGWRSKRHLATNCSVGEALALGARNDQVCALHVIDAQADAVVIPEVKFRDVAVQMMLRAMLVDADHAALENAVVAFDRVGVDEAISDVFASTVAGEVVPGKALAEGGILHRFVGHDVGGGRDVRFDDREQIGASGATDMEATDNRASRATLNQGQNGVFVAIPATDFHVGFVADEGFVDFDDAALATHRAIKAKGFHRFTDAMGHEPTAGHAAAESPLKLAGADPFLAGSHQVDGLQPKAHRDMAALENSPHADSEGLAARVAFIEAGAGGLTLQLPDAAGAAAMLADRAIGPKIRFNVSEGGFFVMKMALGNGGLHRGVSLPPVCPVALGMSSVTSPKLLLVESTRLGGLWPDGRLCRRGGTSLSWVSSIL